MGELARKWKPAASARTHLLLAALLWTAIGVLLMSLGVRRAWGAETVPVAIILAAGAIAGLLKAKFVLRKTAKRSIERIRVRGDGKCIGGFFSVWSWAFVVLMAGMGRILRSGFLPPSALGFMCAAVGVALFTAAIWFWHAWYVHPKFKIAGAVTWGQDSFSSDRH